MLRTSKLRHSCLSRQKSRSILKVPCVKPVQAHVLTACEEPGVNTGHERRHRTVCLLHSSRQKCKRTQVSDNVGSGNSFTGKAHIMRDTRKNRDGGHGWGGTEQSRREGLEAGA